MPRLQLCPYRKVGQQVLRDKVWQGPQVGSQLLVNYLGPDLEITDAEPVLIPKSHVRPKMYEFWHGG